MPATPDRPIAIFYEHPDWFRPLFAELDRRGTPYVKFWAGSHCYDVAEDPPYSLVFNRMSPSAYLRGRENAIFYTLSYLAHLETRGVRVVNGYDAFVTETSKAYQLSLLEKLGLPYPKARVINHPSEASGAADGLRFPVVIKPNIGGSGAGVRRFDSPEMLRQAAESGDLELGIDNVALVQEFIPAEADRIVRVEVLGGKYLYGIRIYTPGDSFDLCPADVCQRVDGAELERAACPADAPKNRLRVESYEPAAEIREQVERIMDVAHIEVGGVEYMIDARDDQLYFYDINALSNFVADAPRVIGFDPFVRLATFSNRRHGKMRFGYWLPVFGGWLRNVEDERMAATWEYVSRLARRSEKIGFDLTLIAELNLNDIKGEDAPSLDAWSTAAALAAVTERLELMVAVRPTFHAPALLAKQAANIDHISSGRLSLNVVSSWWATEAKKYGVQFDRHDDRYARSSEWLDVVSGMWTDSHFDHEGRYYKVEDAVLEPKPLQHPRPTLYAGGESPAAKELISAKCDAWLTHGDPPETIAAKVADLRERREALGKPPMTFGAAGYVVCRPTEAEARREVERITNVSPGSPGYANYQDWLNNTQLEQRVSLEDYSVSNRGLRSGLVGTPEQIAERIRKFEEAGLDLLLLQFSPQYEEMERFAEEVIPLVNGTVHA